MAGKGEKEDGEGVYCPISFFLRLACMARYVYEGCVSVARDSDERFCIVDSTARIHLSRYNSVFAFGQRTYALIRY